MLDFIYMGFVKLTGTWSKKKLQNEKYTRLQLESNSQICDWKINALTTAQWNCLLEIMQKFIHTGTLYACSTRDHIKKSVMSCIAFIYNPIKYASFYCWTNTDVWHRRHYDKYQTKCRLLNWCVMVLTQPCNVNSSFAFVILITCLYVHPFSFKTYFWEKISSLSSSTPRFRSTHSTCDEIHLDIEQWTIL